MQSSGVLIVFLCLLHGSLCRAFFHDRSERYLKLPLKVITMTTEDPEFASGLQYFVDSFNRTNGVDTPMDLTVIQTTSKTYSQLGWRAKLFPVLKTLRELPHDQLVLWADGRDVIWLPCGRDLRKAFKEYRKDIVLGSCQFQFPDSYKEDLFPELPLIMPDIPFPTPWAETTYFQDRFINAGTIIGRAGALRHYIGGAFLRGSNGVLDEPGTDPWNDQSFWADMYLAQFYEDTESASMHPTIAIDSGGLIASRGHEGFNPVNATGYWQWDKSRHTACVLHAPGGQINFDPLHDKYTRIWSKSFKTPAEQQRDVASI